MVWYFSTILNPISGAAGVAKVMEHEKEIIELGDGLERLDEKLDNVDLS